MTPAARSKLVDCQRLAIPDFTTDEHEHRCDLATQRGRSSGTLDTVERNLACFPASRPPCVARSGDYNPTAIEAELARIQAEIDAIAFDLYGFSEADRAAAARRRLALAQMEETAETLRRRDDDDEDRRCPPSTKRMACSAGPSAWPSAASTGDSPPASAPHRPNPTRSILCRPKAPACCLMALRRSIAHAGILVDDPGHPHDLPG